MAEMPPPAPTIPACLIVDIFTRTTVAVRKTRFYYSTTNMPSTGAMAQVVANGMFSVWSGVLSLVMPNTHHVERADVIVQTGSGASIDGSSVIAPVPGVITEILDEVDSDHADELPDEVSLIVQRRTDQPGPANRGRVFITGLSERVQKAGRVDDAYKSTVLAVAGQIANDITLSAGGTYSGGVFHARHWNRKDNILVPVTIGRVVRTMGTRKDRRQPLSLNEKVTL